MEIEDLISFVSNEVEDAFSKCEQSYSLTKIEAIDLFFKFLNLKIDHSDLGDVGADILKALEHYRSDFDISNLADRCEPFLKALAYVINETDYQNLCLMHKGKPSFADLLLHLDLANPKTLGASSPEALFGEPNFAEHTGRTYVARNRVHDAPDYSRKEEALIGCSILVFLVYAVAKHGRKLSSALLRHKAGDNLAQLRARFSKWQTRFVPIEGIEQPSDWLDEFDPVAVELMPEKGDDGRYEDEENTGDDTPEEDDFRELRRGRIIDLVGEVSKMLLLGEPGAGKSTTMQYLAFHAANQLLEGQNHVLPYPVYVELKYVSEARSLPKLLLREAGGSVQSVEELLTGEHLLLLDGWNEVRADQRESVLRDIQYLLNESDESTRFVLSSRPSAYFNQYHLPCFDLQPLSDEQIQSFLRKGFPTQEEGDRFHALLLASPRLHKWARNPLNLEMLLRVGCRTGGALPENRGRLYQLFLKGLMDRERLQSTIISEPTPNEVKERLLSYLAFETRLDQTIAFSFVTAVSLLKESAEVLGARLDIPSFINEVIDNNLLTRAEDDRLSFSHEMYQEYFAAYEISFRVAEKPELVDSLEGAQWEEPIVLYSGIMETRAKFIRQLATRRPLLAARSIMSSIAEEPLLSQDVANAASNMAVGAFGKDVADESLQALVELRDFSAVELVLRDTRNLAKEHKKAIEKTVAESDIDTILGFAEVMATSSNKKIGLTWLCNGLCERGQRFESSGRACRLRELIRSKKRSSFEAACIAWFTKQENAMIILSSVIRENTKIYQVEVLAKAIASSCGESEKDHLLQWLGGFLRGKNPSKLSELKLSNTCAAYAGITNACGQDVRSYNYSEDVIATLSTAGIVGSKKSRNAIQLSHALINVHRQDLRNESEKIVSALLPDGGDKHSIHGVCHALVASEILGGTVNLPLRSIVESLLQRNGDHFDSDDLLAIAIIDRFSLVPSDSTMELMRRLLPSNNDRNYVKDLEGLITKAKKFLRLSIGKVDDEDLKDPHMRKLRNKGLVGKIWDLRVIYMIDATMGFAKSENFPKGVLFRANSLQKGAKPEPGDRIEAKLSIRLNRKKNVWSYIVKSGKLLEKGG